MDIKELVEKSQKGEKEAFGQIYDLYTDRIFRYIRLKVQNQEAAEDILQEVFLKTWKALPSLPLANLNFNAWIYKIAANTINDHFRKIYRNPENLELDENLDIESSENLQKQVEKDADLDTIKRTLQELPRQYQQVLELRFVQDFTLQETADILDKSNLAVRVLQHRALKQLKEVLQKNYDLQYEKI